MINKSEIKIIEEVGFKLTTIPKLQDGEVLVITFSNDLIFVDSQIEMIQKIIRDIFPNNKVLVTLGEVSFEIK